ncbi:polymorphic toxin-type HINT domain-containing protein [Longispora albida]|uniref:polymorphic toxin-type HINT domain-containing protein n=1 Tax=Longispora albida TaxID=203523 RepID=UPI00039CB2BD|nr:polymorphic toxin-type HINT domain-containing protein [Longispora albida]
MSRSLSRRPHLPSLRKVLTLTLGAALVVTLPGAPPALAAVVDAKPAQAQKEKPVSGSGRAGATPEAVPGKPFQGAAPVWPAPGVAEVNFSADGTQTAGAARSNTKAGALPVWVSPVRQPAGVKAAGADAVAAPSATGARVEVLDRSLALKAGVDGLFLRVSAPEAPVNAASADGFRTAAPASTGPVRVDVDYSKFRWAYGGDWAARLKLVKLPECALTTPGKPECRGTELPSKNNTRDGKVTVELPSASTAKSAKGVQAASASGSGGTLMALSAAPSGASGDFSATSLTPSATWSGGSNSGDFSWSYPLRSPPALGGPAPSVSIGYSSASVDGRMAASNNQPSWLGEGWDWDPGSIERKYQACSEDMTNSNNNTEKTGDQCWATDNATMSMSGHAGELIKDPNNANRWHLRNDDGTFVERRTGSGNGALNGEYWVATTTDGVQYWFGKSAQSTLTVPVAGNNPGEPCRQATFAASFCTQAYRWNLEYVVDLNGNTMTYFYGKETGKYAKNLKTDQDPVTYDRSSYVDRIEYGTRTDVAGVPFTVKFDVADRCVTAACGTHDATNWPDTPWDQDCTGKPCNNVAPSFWSTKRLAKVTTKVGANAVEEWTFTHSFEDPGDGTRAGLWLKKIGHRGLAGGQTTTLPDVTFAGIQLSNRVDTIDHSPAMNWWRVKTVSNESGGKLDVTYSAQECVASSNVPDVSNLHLNTKRCYPVKWTPPGHTTPVTDFFHKYLVTDVVESDLVGGATAVRTHYDYPGTPAWHYSDDDGMVKAENKTWSVWRGYGAVQTTKGEGAERTFTETRFFRGMHGDKYGAGTRTEVMPAIATGGIPAINDEDVYAGMTREAIVYNGPGGAEVSAEVSVPWHSGETATRTLNGITVKARFTNPAAEKHTRIALDGGRAPRTTSTATTFEGTYGTPTEVEDRGTPAAGDEQCTLTDYARNTGAAWLTGAVKRTRSFAVDCTKAKAGTGLTDADVLTDELTSYDGLAHGTAPTRGQVTKTETMKSYNAGSPVYFTTGETTYDTHGRIKTAKDVRGGTTTTDYTPASGGPLTAKTETSPLGWTSSETFDPAYGLPMSKVDANGRKLDFAYDGLGRLISVWKPGRDKGAQSATITYDYLVRNDKPTVITSKKINQAGNYIATHDLYDGLWRKRQTQKPDAAGGPNAVVTDILYDTAGREQRTNDPYLGTAVPGTTLFMPSEVIPSQTGKVFDGAGRTIAEVMRVSAPSGGSHGGTEKWRTTTYHAGDRTDVTPPNGGTASSAIVDAHGKTVEYRQYKGAAPTPGTAGSYDSTFYEYNRKDQLAKVTGPSGLVWTYEYDLLGRATKSVDPDKGTSFSEFNDAGDLVSTTDARGTKLVTGYDAIGRKTGVYKDSIAPANKRAEWVYDTMTVGNPVKGQLVKATRYEPEGAYSRESTGFTIDYQPTRVVHTIPGTEVGGTYTYVYTYNQDGTPDTIRMPLAGDLKLETLTYGYDAQGQPSTLRSKYGTSLETSLVMSTSYTSFGELGAYTLQHNGGNAVDVVKNYDTTTRKLSQIWTSKQTGPTTISDIRYDYDDIGNVKRSADLTSGDVQCYKSDYLRRTTDAWTPANGDCNTAPESATLGGAAKYRHVYEYDKAGNRIKLTEYETANGTRTTSYTPYPGKNSLKETTSTETAGGTKTSAWAYDAMGNMKSRPTPSDGNQTMTWDAEGHLASSSDGSGTTTYVYDIDGNRILRKDPKGTTLYLPGQELRYTSATGAKTCTRYYSHASTTVASRVAAGITWVSSDHHGTASITVDAMTQAVSARLMTPFGTERKKDSSWPTWLDKGFVGGTIDNTGLTHVGAREYDPSTGRFVSVDPVIDNKDPQQMHGYAYGNNAPMTYVDEDGRWGLPKFVKNVASAVKNTVSNAVSTVGNAAKAVGNAAKAAGQWVYDNAGTISTVLQVAAIACAIIPPLQAAAPFLQAASTAVGAIETFKTCSEGMSLDCATGLMDLVPGGRAVSTPVKGAKAAAKAGQKSADDAVEAAADVGGAACPIAPGRKKHSFDPETPVLMADGTKEPIGDIDLGDEVMATDPATGETKAEPVTILHSNRDTELTELTVADENGETETLSTTQNHPFWDATSGAWADAGKLVPGRELYTIDGHRITVIEVRNHTGSKQMRDLTVANLHTYYVVAAGAPVLVHNNGKFDPCRPGDQELDSEQDALDAAYDRAGIPRGTQPDAEWEVGNDPLRRGQPGYRYSEDTGGHGRYRQFETDNGSRVIAHHTNDGDPHFHAGQPKGGADRDGVDFGWGTGKDYERYQQVGGKHHLYYKMTRLLE